MATYKIDRNAVVNCMTKVLVVSQNMDTAAADVTHISSELMESGVLSGDRAELYKEVLDKVKELVDQLRKCSSALSKAVIVKNEQLGTNIDVKKVDTAAQAVQKKVADKKKQLKGQ